ncbi:MAG: sulfatase-like hydrolase/transferase [Candidatus Schekmanbacteria bacterium]|nr:sulfatase-like hydrolase/transferase [Candidatus Schekmanbacteria bacterium]
MDTTRADRLRCYGNKNIVTSNIDTLFKRGYMFANAVSPAPVTLPSHSSIMTGLFPINHGARDNSIYRLSPDNVTLAEVLKEKGYNTAAFVSSFILDSQYGVNQGFATYNDRFLHPQQKGRLPVERRGIETATLAAEWLKNNAGKEPFFMWTHFYDPHAEYDPPEPFKTAYESDPYNGEIAYTDMCIGLLIDELKKDNLFDSTLIVITADHGESLNEHNEQTHGMFVYDSTLHVPLIISYRGFTEGGEKINDQVRSVDIFPTVLELLGITNNSKTDGKSIVPLMNGEKMEELPSYCEAEIPKSFYWNALKGVRYKGWEYIYGRKPELYNLEKDPAEKENLISKEGAKAAELQGILKKIVEDRNKRISTSIAPVDEETVERLKSLGYFQAGGTSGKEGKDEEFLTSFTRPDPSEQISLYRKYQRLTNLADSKEYEPAEKGLLEIIRQDPQNPRFIATLGKMYEDMGKIEDAIFRYEEASKIDKDNSRYYFLIGNLYGKEGKEEKAVDFYRKTLISDPSHFMAHYNLGRHYTVKGKFEDAIKEYETTLKLKPDHSYSLNNLAYIYIEKFKDVKKGVEYLKEAAKSAPGTPFIRDNLGWALMEAGDYNGAIEECSAAVKIDPNNPQYLLHLGDAYKKKGNREMALENWKKALEIKPDFKEAKDRLKAG